MKKLILLLLLLSSSPLFARHIDTKQYVILPYVSGMLMSGQFPINSINSALSEKEILKAERLLDECLKEFNSEQEKKFNGLHKKYPQLTRKGFIVDKKNYKRQYIVVTTPKGEKQLWINCFCSDTEKNWKKELVYVIDGGSCFFNLKINLTQNKFYDFFVNADA
jgi:hypothetical protein